MPKLLLKADVAKLGRIGDLVEVGEAYARNYLLPQGLAVKPTPANLKVVEEARKIAEAKRLKALEEKRAAAAKVAGAEVSIVAKANDQGHLFGSVSEKDIADALNQNGYNVHASYIRLAEHIKQVDKYEVKVNFGDDIEATITVWVAPAKDAAGNLVKPASADVAGDDDYDYDQDDKNRE